MSFRSSLVVALLLATLLSASALAAGPSFVKVTTVAASDNAHDILKAPLALAIVRSTGDLVIADTLHHRILRVSPAGDVTVLAGNGTPGHVDGAGAQARFKEPAGIAVDDARSLIYVADSGNHEIRIVTFGGIVGTLAGSGQPEDKDGAGRQAGFKQPSGIAVDAAGTVLVADTGNSRIKQVTPAGVVTTIAGDLHEGFADGNASKAQFKAPHGIVFGSDGAIYIADTKNSVIRKLQNGVVSTVAGTGHVGFVDGPGAVAEFNEPSGIACDEAGNLYVSDAKNNAVRRVVANGSVTVTTIAGAQKPGFADGNLAAALFRAPGGAAFAGALFIADTGNDAIRRVDAQVAVNAIDPKTGAPAGGTEVHVFGAGFVPGQTTVAFGSELATTVTYVNSTEVVAITPPVTGIVDVTVTTPGGTATLPSAYSAVPPPTIATVTPRQGKTGGGDLVTITGTNFTSGTIVKFGSVTADSVTVASSNSLAAMTPQHAAGAVDVSVITGGGSAAKPTGFTYFAPPVIASFSPAEGTAGTVITINGANFDSDPSGDSVLFGTLSALVTTASSTQLVVGAPNGVTTSRITVTTAGGSVTSTANFSTTTYSSLEITAPVTSFDQGDTIPFNAIARLLTGSAADVSTQAVWTTSDANVATVTNGFVTGQGVGSVTITATFGGFSAAKLVVIRTSTVPAAVPSTIDRSVVQPLADTIRFLYTGPNALQTGVATNAINDDRVTTVRGAVHTRDGAPIAGVEISVAAHPELGRTFTRADGIFDLALNGGGAATLVYRKAGWLEAQRLVTSQWNEQKVVGDVLLVPFDPGVSLITIGSPVPQRARATTVTDRDGARTATLIVPAGEGATVIAADGATTTPSLLHIRATEYTVGANGPSAMPAPLPPMSAYTYCVELSADEAPGGTVQFSKPLSLYFENFLGFPVGTAIPVGYYDRAKQHWTAARNGRVIGIVAITNGVAAVDANGDGAPDADATLAQLGIDAGERKELAALYAPGQSLWRARIDHFTPWDINSPIWPNGAARPKVRKPKKINGRTQVDCSVGGWSIVDCANQTLGESIPIAGTPYTLDYNSARAARNEYSTEIELSQDISERLVLIELEVSIAGQVMRRTFPPLPNQKYTFTWDGNDGFGRPVQGARTAAITITYYYPMEYGSSAVDPAWNTPANAPVPSNTSRDFYSLSQDSQVILGHFDVLNAGFGDWSFSAQRQYDGIGRTIYEGGDERSTDPQQTGETAITTLPIGDPDLLDLFTMAPAPDGTLYFSDGYKIRKLSPDGTTADVAGTSGPVQQLHR